MSLIFQFNSNKVHEMHGNVDFQSAMVTDGFSDGDDTRFIINASTFQVSEQGSLFHVYFIYSQPQQALNWTQGPVYLYKISLFIALILFKCLNADDHSGCMGHVVLF